MTIEPIRRTPLDYRKLTRAFVYLALAEHSAPQGREARPPTAATNGPVGGTPAHTRLQAGGAAPEGTNGPPGAHNGSHGEAE